MISTLTPAREILIAIPGLPRDLYQMHQCVWQHAERAARPGTRPTFLYRVEDGMVRVRSREFARGMTRALRPGRCSLDIAAVIQTAEGHERAVAPWDIRTWATAKLERAGFGVRELSLVNYDQQHGIKRDKATGRTLRITLPVARLDLDLIIDNEAQASAAWLDGIGRGRRFGLGMICH